MTDHHCEKETEIAEIKQTLKIYEEHELQVNEYVQEMSALKEWQKQFEGRYEETLQVIHEINDCQRQLIKEAIKTNTTFKGLKYCFGISITLFGGILTFLMMELIKLIH